MFKILSASHLEPTVLCCQGWHATMWSHTRASPSWPTVTSFPLSSLFQFLFASDRNIWLDYSYCHPHGYFMCSSPAAFHELSLLWTMLILRNAFSLYCHILPMSPPLVILQKHLIELNYLHSILYLWFTKCNWKKIISATYTHFCLPFCQLSD